MRKQRQIAGGRNHADMGETMDTNKMACTALKSITSSNLQLYSQADKKARILIQVNALMISIFLTTAI